MLTIRRVRTDNICQPSFRENIYISPSLGFANSQLFTRRILGFARNDMNILYTCRKVAQESPTILEILLSPFE